jgi:SAM-dependent methyltransferase
MHTLSGANAPLLRAADLQPGHRVVDVGCGSGDPALDIGSWVGPRGSVLGIDVSSTMLETARRRARILGARNVRFRRADIARYRHSGTRFDRLVSRFGLMFADDVPRALECMRRSLKRGGRAAIAVWGPITANPGTSLRAEATRPFETTPPADPESSAHPMRLARQGLLPRLMRSAGFVRVKAEPARLCWTYPSVEDYVRMQIDLTLGDLYRSLSPRDRRRMCERLRRAILPYRSGEVVRYPGQAWIATGLAP